MPKAEPNDFVASISDRVVAGVTQAIMQELKSLVTPPREWLTEAECDDELGYKRGTLAARRRHGEPSPESYGGGKQRRISRAALAAYVRSLGRWPARASSEEG
jgi:hypothetical protein